MIFPGHQLNSVPGFYKGIHFRKWSKLNSRTWTLEPGHKSDSVLVFGSDSWKLFMVLYFLVQSDDFRLIMFSGAYSKLQST